MALRGARVLRAFRQIHSKLWKSVFFLAETRWLFTSSYNTMTPELVVTTLSFLCLWSQGKPIHYLDGRRLCGLLSKARNLGGDRLAIDIMETEVTLRLYGRVETSATVIQVWRMCPFFSPGLSFSITTLGMRYWNRQKSVLRPSRTEKRWHPLWRWSWALCIHAFFSFCSHPVRNQRNISIKEGA